MNKRQICKFTKLQELFEGAITDNINPLIEYVRKPLYFPAFEPLLEKENSIMNLTFENFEYARPQFDQFSDSFRDALIRFQKASSAEEQARALNSINEQQPNQVVLDHQKY